MCGGVGADACAAKDLKPAMPDAVKILLSNVYGWFDRVERGIYKLFDVGKLPLLQW